MMQSSSTSRIAPALTAVATLLVYAAPAAAEPTGESKVTEPEEPTVRLHVESSAGPVTIERVDTGAFVCTSPCDEDVPATALYRIGGRRPSDTFILDGRKGDAKIDVDPASSRGFWTGALTLAGAGALVGSGALALALGYASRGDVPGSDGTVTDTTYTDTMLLGTVLLTAGVTAGIWGGATLAATLKSRVTGSVVKAPPVRGNTQPLRTATSGPLWTAGPTFYLPLLGGTF